MNNELIMVILPSASWLLFALGGTQISATVPGWKGWRRFVLPVVFAVFCILASTLWWQALITLITAIAVYIQGYGSKATWLKRALIAIGYGLIGASIGLSIWNLLTPLVFMLLFKLSNWKPTAGLFVWKVCEGFFGLMCGIQLAYVLMKHGLIWIK